MADLAEEEEYFFDSNPKKDDPSREMHRLLERLDQSTIMEEPSYESTPIPKQGAGAGVASDRKVDRDGNFRYFDDSDEDYLDPYHNEDRDDYEEERKQGAGSSGKVNRTFTGSGE